MLNFRLLLFYFMVCFSQVQAHEPDKLSALGSEKLKTYARTTALSSDQFEQPVLMHEEKKADDTDESITANLAATCTRKFNHVIDALIKIQQKLRRMKDGRKDPYEPMFLMHELCEQTDEQEKPQSNDLGSLQKHEAVVASAVIGAVVAAAGALTAYCISGQTKKAPKLKNPQVKKYENLPEVALKLKELHALCASCTMIHELAVAIALPDQPSTYRITDAAFNAKHGHLALEIVHRNQTPGQRRVVATSAHYLINLAIDMTVKNLDPQKIYQGVSAAATFIYSSVTINKIVKDAKKNGECGLKDKEKKEDEEKKRKEDEKKALELLEKAGFVLAATGVAGKLVYESGKMGCNAANEIKVTIHAHYKDEHGRTVVSATDINGGQHIVVHDPQFPGLVHTVDESSMHPDLFQKVGKFSDRKKSYQGWFEHRAVEQAHEKKEQNHEL